MHQEQITRKQLYDLVWSTPLTTIATQFGISDNGLRKICNKLDIPLPKAGHWMKLQYNKKVQIVPLPSSENDDTTITFSVKDLKEFDKKAALVKKIKETVVPFSVPQRLTQADPLIVQAKQSLLAKDALKTFRQSDMVRTRRGELDIIVTLKNVNRALCFMDAFIKALYKRGHEILLRNDSTNVSVKDQEFRIAFREKTKRVLVHGRSWNSSEYHPTGILCFKYDGYGNKEWKDGHQPLETKIPDIIAKLETVSDELTEAQERNRRHFEEIRQREQIEKNRVETKRKELSDFKQLLKEAERWQKTNLLRRYIKTVEEHANKTGMSEEMQTWLEWSRKKADWYDPFIEAHDELLQDADRTKLVFETN